VIVVYRENAVLTYNAQVIQRLARAHIARQRRRAQYWKYSLIVQEQKALKLQAAKEVGGRVDTYERGEIYPVLDGGGGGGGR